MGRFQYIKIKMMILKTPERKERLFIKGIIDWQLIFQEQQWKLEKYLQKC